jgi:hypothetical protein
MSFNNSGNTQLIQQFVDRYGNLGRNYSVFNFVLTTSQQNNKVTLDPNTFLKAPGKKRRVIVNYFPVLCDVLGDCDAGICDKGQKVEPKQQIFDITKCIASKIFTIDKNDIRLTDNGAWDFNGTALSIIASALPQLRREHAKALTTYLYDLAGVFPDGNGNKRVSVTNPATGVINPMGKLQIEREYLDAGFMAPNIYGGSEVYNWQNMTQIAGLNAQGQNLAQTNTNNTWYDEGLSDLILDDTDTGGHILTIAPEVFKYVWYSENAGIFSTDMASIEGLGMLYRRGIDGFIEGTLIDPETGIVWDLYITYDKCDQQWNFQLKHHYDLFVLPDIACNAAGVNGIFHWRTCPQVIAACPTGDTPSPAVAETTFAWTPGDIFPLSVQSMNIGGVVTQPLTDVADISALATLMTQNYQGSAVTFSVNGSDIEYDGYVELDGNINGTVTINFAP